MAKKFKDYYDTGCAELISGKIKDVWPSFDTEGFVSKIDAQLDGKEFHQRQDLFVDAFEQFMPKIYSETIAIFSSVAGK